LAESLGTFTLVALGPGAIMVAAKSGAFGHAEIALAFGLAVAVAVASIGAISGAHINPAVSLALWSVGRFPGREVLPYALSQSLGAVIASALLGWILGPVGGFGVTAPAIPLAQAFVVEAGYSGLLAFVIMAVAVDGRASKSSVPFILGFTVGAGALVTGPLTGGSFNPARSLGPAVLSGTWTAHWLYWAAPCVGMLLAVRLYQMLFSLRRDAHVAHGQPT
jgi:MIP family channel proteins